MAITNRTVYAEPTLPTIGGAGSTFTDPTFGSRMARVTDGASITDLGTTNRSFRSPASGDQQGWNATGTKFVIHHGDGNASCWSFDRASMATARIGGFLPLLGALTWDPTDANLVYGTKAAANNHTLGVVDVSSLPLTATVLLDLDTVTGGLNSPVTYVGALTVGDGNLMCTYGGIGQEYMRYVLHYPLADPGSLQVLDTLTRMNQDEVDSLYTVHGAHIDKSGRFHIIVPTASTIPTGSIALYRIYVWDAQLDTVTPITSHAGGHDVLGYGTRLNSDTLTTFDAFQTIKTPALTDPNSNRTELVSPLGSPIEVFAADHSSWTNVSPTNSEPVTIAVYRYYDGPNNIDPRNNVAFRAWDNEIVTLGMDGVVTRYCHHRSPVYPFVGTASFNFWDTPRPNVDPFGQFAYFTSNWDKSLGWDDGDSEYRQDVFVVELSEAARRAYRRARRFR